MEIIPFVNLVGRGITVFRNQVNFSSSFPFIFPQEGHVRQHAPFPLVCKSRRLVFRPKRIASLTRTDCTLRVVMTKRAAPSARTFPFSLVLPLREEVVSPDPVQSIPGSRHAWGVGSPLASRGFPGAPARRVRRVCVCAATFENVQHADERVGVSASLTCPSGQQRRSRSVRSSSVTVGGRSLKGRRSVYLDAK